MWWPLSAHLPMQHQQGSRAARSRPTHVHMPLSHLAHLAPSTLSGNLSTGSKKAQEKGWDVLRRSHQAQWFPAENGETEPLKTCVPSTKITPQAYVLSSSPRRLDELSNFSHPLNTIPMLPAQTSGAILDLHNDWVRRDVLLILGGQEPKMPAALKCTVQSHPRKKHHSSHKTGYPGAQAHGFQSCLQLLSLVPNSFYTWTQSTVLHGIILLLTHFPKCKYYLLKRRKYLAILPNITRSSDHLENRIVENMLFRSPELHTSISQSSADSFMGITQKSVSMYFLCHPEWLCLLIKYTIITFLLFCLYNSF